MFYCSANSCYRSRKPKENQKLSHILWLMSLVCFFFFFFIHFYSTHSEWVVFFLDIDTKKNQIDPHLCKSLCSKVYKWPRKKCPKTRIDDIKFHGWKRWSMWSSKSFNAAPQHLGESKYARFFLHHTGAHSFYESSFSANQRDCSLVNNQAIRVNFMEFDWFFNAIGECLLAIWLNLRSNERERDRDCWVLRVRSIETVCCIMCILVGWPFTKYHSFNLGEYLPWQISHVLWNQEKRKKTEKSE